MESLRMIIGLDRVYTNTAIRYTIAFRRLDKYIPHLHGDITVSNPSMKSDLLMMVFSEPA